MIASVHPFGIESPGGGPRILRALYENPPVEVLSVVTSVTPPPPTRLLHEVHVRPRPPLPRVDATRLRLYVDLWTRRFTRPFIRKLAAAYGDATAAHIVLHDGTALPAVAAARARGIPYYLSIHDDIDYHERRWARSAPSHEALTDAWQGAAARFAISDEIGREYCRRYGDAEYLIVTDGVESLPDEPRAAGDGYAIYFMGLLHLSYEEDFLTLMETVKILHRNARGRPVSLRARCQLFPTPALATKAERLADLVTVLPFDSEQVVAQDIAESDALYLPLPFGERHESFVRNSFSTKLITYLGSGVPIVYHGPPYGAAYEVIADADAGFVVTSQDPYELARAFRATAADRERVAANALAVARNKFLLADQKARFWGTILG